MPEVIVGHIHLRLSEPLSIIILMLSHYLLLFSSKILQRDFSHQNSVYIFSVTYTNHIYIYISYPVVLHFIVLTIICDLYKYRSFVLNNTLNFLRRPYFLVQYRNKIHDVWIWTLNCVQRSLTYEYVSWGVCAPTE